jgi:predicted AAA+ superfamily ATPase
MSSAPSGQVNAWLAEKLADSLSTPLPKLTPRSIHGAVSLPGKATAVVGMRRAGKTFFLHQLRKEQLEKGTPRERLPYINFEDERLEGMETGHLTSLVETCYRQHPVLRSRETVTWFFDEIQVVPGWERFVRRLIDSEKVQVFITGSSASLLSREIATALRGRAWEVVVHPFGFAESLRHRDMNVPVQAQALSAPERSALERSFLDYLSAGGFPEAQGLDSPTRMQMLNDYVDVAMLRDVVERHSVTNVAGLRWLLRHLMGNAGALFSIEKFYASLKSQGFAISKDTVHNLLAFVEDCFLVRTVWMEARSERQRMVNPRKAYPVDPGLIPVFDRSGRRNLGHALETTVLVELERRGAAVTYVRTPSGREVDFLARHRDGSRELIQVCADPADSETMARELLALQEAGDLYKQATRRLLVLNRDVREPEVPRGVIVQPAWLWMLS